MAKTLTLREWIESAVSKSYFGTTLERISLAEKFMSQCKVLLGDKKSMATVAMLNPDTIKVTVNDVTGVVSYDVCFPSFTHQRKLKNTKYTNLDYASTSIVKFCSARRKHANLFEICKRLNEKDKTYTVAVNLFYIIFACHPFKGAEYFKSSVDDLERDYEVFGGEKKFIFSPEYYDSEKIDGYHKYPNDLWNKLKKEQRIFFTEAFFWGGYRCADLFQKWQSYFQYSEVVLKTLCGEDIRGFAFDNDYTLIATDIAVWDNVARCIYYKKEFKDKCKNCPNSSSAFVTGASVNICLTVTDAALGKTPTHASKKLVKLRVGDTLTGRMLDEKNGGDQAVFRVIPTKKIDVLGCEYLGECPLYLEGADPANSMVLRKSNKFKLNPNDKIYLTPSVIFEVIGTNEMNVAPV